VNLGGSGTNVEAEGLGEKARGRGGCGTVNAGGFALANVTKRVLMSNKVFPHERKRIKGGRKKRNYQLVRSPKSTVCLSTAGKRKKVGVSVRSSFEKKGAGGGERKGTRTGKVSAQEVSA